jgi:hypothetical protein
MRARTQLKWWKKQQQAVRDKLGTDAQCPIALNTRLSTIFHQMRGDSQQGVVDDCDAVQEGLAALGIAASSSSTKAFLSEAGGQMDETGWVALVNQWLVTYGIIELPPSASAINARGSRYSNGELAVSSRTQFGSLEMPPPPTPHRYRRRRRVSAPALLTRDPGVSASSCASPSSHRQPPQPVVSRRLPRLSAPVLTGGSAS